MKMLDNASYNKIKIMYELSSNIWFIEKHAKPDAQNAGDLECLEMLNLLQNDLQKHLEKFQKAVCTISQ